MDARRNLFESILRNSFHLEYFEKFVMEFFSNSNMKNFQKQIQVSDWSEFGRHIKGYHYMANFSASDNKEIAIFAIELNDSKSLDKARSLQRNFIKKLLKSSLIDAAFVAFYADSDSKWRLSFIKLDYEFLAGKVTEEITPAKRYSYLVGKDEPCHTALERLFPIFMKEGTNPTVSEIEDAFSVEAVTKEFFEKYNKKYEQLKEHLEANQDFINEANYLGFTGEQFAKKLMGQIVFLYFIQKKGWLGVNSFPKTKTLFTKRDYEKILYARSRKPSEVVQKIFINKGIDENIFFPEKIKELSQNEQEELAASFSGQPWGTGPKDFIRKLYNVCVKNERNFYNDYLKPLFYEALSQKREANDYYYRLNCRIPFLNGGLFEPLEGYDWKKNDFDISNDIFSNADKSGTYGADGILDIFDRYNFTMNEDEPLEKEVAVDPEMLGKVFENLLDVKERKSKGAFYTPREIVHYMCQESLSNYLATKTGVPYEDIKDFIIYGELMKDEDTSHGLSKNRELLISNKILDLTKNVNRLDDIDRALADVTIADPAVGSGAFPLGMISEIIHARRNLSGYFEMILKKSAVSNKQAEYLINEMYRDTRHPLRLKLHTIEKSIFAVDIEPSAVDITKLRLWLSLVVEQEIDDQNTDQRFIAIKNPRPLPNLDCNIRCGNSLISEIDGATLINESELFGKNENQQTYIGQSHYESLLQQLFKAQENLFSEENNAEKKRHKDEIRDKTDKIVMFNIHENPELVEKYNSLKNEPSPPFFVWQLEFARVFDLNSGFDIVIGNPPYVSTKGVSSKDKKAFVHEYGFSDDTYTHFFYKGNEILAKRGNLTYITPKTFWTTQTKRNLRELLLSKRILYIFDTANPFEAAMVDTCITAYQNSCSENNDEIVFLDGSKSLSKPTELRVKQSIYINAQNLVVFKPTTENLRIYELFGEKVKTLYNTWWDKISTSRNIEKNKHVLEQYRESLKPGDITLLGCITEGGQGLATANNGKYIAVRKSTKWAGNIVNSRPIKLAEAIKQNRIQMPGLDDFKNVSAYLETLSEGQIAELFDSLKEEYGRDIFGQGYIYRLIEDEEIADVDSLTDNEKQNGIHESKLYYVPYDKGDKDGNRWYLETPFAIAWSQKNVGFLKANSGKKGKGMPVVRNPQFYFKEGFCWTNILNPQARLLKSKMKGKTVNDVGSMSLSSIVDALPNYYLVVLLNSELMFDYYREFINCTVNIQINDIRQLPVLVPSEYQLEKCKLLFDKAVALKKAALTNKNLESNIELELVAKENELNAFVDSLYAI